jgi:hypothetical protein
VLTEGLANKIGRLAIGPASTLAVTPAQALNQVGTVATVTASTTAAGDVAGVTVRFQVGGANTASGTVLSDANGTASFTYTVANLDQDTISAFADNDNDGIHDANEPAATATTPWFGALATATGAFVIGDQNAASARR